MKRIISLLFVVAVSSVLSAVPSYKLSLREMGYGEDWPVLFVGEQFSCEEGKFAGSVASGKNGFGETVDFTITSTLGKDRGLIARFEFPVSREGKTWCGTIGREEPIKGTNGNYSNSYTYNPRHFLADGKDISGKKADLTFVYVQSETFIGSVYDAETGLAIAVPRDLYCMFNIFYDNAVQALVIEYYFGLTDAAAKHDNAAFRFFVTEFDAKDYGFRRVLQSYYDNFPQYTHKRFDKNGSMMAFIPPGDVNNHDEIGLATVWGARGGAAVRGLKYTVPGQLFVNTPNKKDSTTEEIMACIEEKFKGKGAVESICRKADGNPVILSTYYADFLGTVNNDPAFPYGRAFLEEIKQTLEKEAAYYGGIAYDGLLGGMNFNRDHFPLTNFALLYNPASEKCFINNYFSCLQLAKAVHAATNAPVKVISANVTKPDLLFGAPFVDVTTGEPTPRVDYRELAALRQACGKKTVALLTKHLYIVDREGMERYFKHCLALGVYPGYFDGGTSALNSGSSYFSNSRWLEPARPLWRKYMSLAKDLANAGWEPLPLAIVDNAPSAVVERFGKMFGLQYFTVRNPGYSAPKAVLRIQQRKLFDKISQSDFGNIVVVDELLGKHLKSTVQGDELIVDLPLGVDDVRVISVNTADSLRARAVGKAVRILDDRMVTRKFESARGERLDAWQGYYKIVRTGGHTGKQCVSSCPSLVLSQKSFYPMGAPKEIKVGLWVKAEDLQEPFVCVVKVTEHNSPSRFSEPQRIVFPKGTYDWQYGSVTIKTQNNFGGIFFNISYKSNGKVYVDDVEYIVDGENIATDPSFEGFVPEEAFLKECDKLYGTMKAGLEKVRDNTFVKEGTFADVLQNLRGALFSMPYTREYRDMEEIHSLFVTAGLAQPPVTFDINVPGAADFGAKLAGKFTVTNKFGYDIPADKVMLYVGNAKVLPIGKPVIPAGKKEEYSFAFDMQRDDVTVEVSCLGAHAEAKVLSTPIGVSVLNAETLPNGTLRANILIDSRLGIPIMATVRYGWRNGISQEKKVRVQGSTKTFVELDKPQGESGNFILLVSVENEQYKSACTYTYRMGQLAAEAVPRVDSAFSGYSEKALNDGIIYGDENTPWQQKAWASNEETKEHWASLTFNRLIGKKLVIYWHKEEGVEYISRNFDVQVLGNEGGWKTIQQIRDNKADVVNVAIPSPGKAYRVLQLPGGGSPTRPNLMWVTEIEVY
ncbi:MAG: hypothetical protein IKP00_13790 [Victivallales bacterium]|nr:hypothetical protein [Victivallales bacterium]